EPGAPSWHELHTSAYDKSLAFYQKVFGWKTQTVGDSPEFRYTLLVDGDQQLAGVMDATAWLPPGVPAVWSIYFSVENADDTLQQIERLGGTVVQAAETTPYGRLATATDPTGAQFRLQQPA